MHIRGITAARFSWKTPAGAPPVLEQDRIVSYLERVISSNKVLCDLPSQSIVLAKERRATLLTAAVTGQIPVEELLP